MKLAFQGLKLKNKRGFALLRTLTTEDLQSVITLQQQVYGEIENKNLFVCSTSEEITLCIDKGLAIGAFYEQKLIAYAFGISAKFKEKPYYSFIDNKENGEKNVDIMDFEELAVDEEFRGNSLQKVLSVLMIELARNLAFKAVYCCASPENSFSVNNLLSVGFEIIKTTEVFENKQRHIFEFDLKKQTEL